MRRVPVIRVASRSIKAIAERTVAPEEETSVPRVQGANGRVGPRARTFRPVVEDNRQLDQERSLSLHRVGRRATVPKAGPMGPREAEEIQVEMAMAAGKAPKMTVTTMSPPHP